MDGTAHGQRERAAFFSRNAATPMMVIAVGAGPRIARVLPELGALLTRPLLTLERVRICKRDGELLSAPPALPAARPAEGDSGLPAWHKLMVYTSEAALHDGQPVHRTIVRRLAQRGDRGRDHPARHVGLISIRFIDNQAWRGGDENVEITDPNARPRKQCRHVKLPL